MNAEFNWWLLIVGLVFGAALVWLVLADSSRRESEIADEELPKEATWIATTMSDRGRPLTPEAAEEVLRLHRAYLASLPPDEEDEVWDETWDETEADAQEVQAGDRTPRREPSRTPDARAAITPLARSPREGQPSQDRGAGS